MMMWLSRYLDYPQKWEWRRVMKKLFRDSLLGILLTCVLATPAFAVEDASITFDKSSSPWSVFADGQNIFVQNIYHSTAYRLDLANLKVIQTINTLGQFKNISLADINGDGQNEWVGLAAGYVGYNIAIVNPNAKYPAYVALPTSMYPIDLTVNTKKQIFVLGSKGQLFQSDTKQAKLIYTFPKGVEGRSLAYSDIGLLVGTNKGIYLQDAQGQFVFLNNNNSDLNPLMIRSLNTQLVVLNGYDQNTLTGNNLNIINKQTGKNTVIPISIKFIQAFDLGDVDGDGNTDITVAGYFNEVVTLYGDSKGNFTQGTVNQLSKTTPLTTILVKDINQDQKADILVVGPQATKSVFIIYGKALPNTVKVCKATPNNIKSGDHNADGHADCGVSK